MQRTIQFGVVSTCWTRSAFCCPGVIGCSGATQLSTPVSANRSSRVAIFSSFAPELGGVQPRSIVAGPVLGGVQPGPTGMQRRTEFADVVTVRSKAKPVATAGLGARGDSLTSDMGDALTSDMGDALTNDQRADTSGGAATSAGTSWGMATGVTTACVTTSGVTTSCSAGGASSGMVAGSVFLLALGACLLLQHAPNMSGSGCCVVFAEAGQLV